MQLLLKSPEKVFDEKMQSEGMLLSRDKQVKRPVSYSWLKSNEK